MITIPRNVGVSVVASLLTVILIYSSITEFHVIAKPPKHIDTLCRDATPTAPGAVKAQICCNVVNGVIQICNKCQYDANDNAIDSACINFYPERQMPGGNSTLPPPSLGTVLPSSGNNTGLITNGQTGPPNHLGTVLSSGSNNNTGTLPASTVAKEHNTSSPQVLSSTGNPSNNNQQTSGHHHHEGEQNVGTSSSENTNNNPSNGGTSNGKSSNSNNNNNKK